MAKVSGENPFWNFSVKVYSRDGVAPACLRLQDQVGADVNILMYCCWVAHDHGVRFDESSLGRVLGLTEPWTATVVEPLRTIRRALKLATHSGFDPDDQERLRTEIKRIELRSERMQHDALFAAANITKAGAPEARRDVGRHNIDFYLSTLNTGIDETAQQDIDLLIAAAFDISETDGNQISSASRRD